MKRRTAIGLLLAALALSASVRGRVATPRPAWADSLQSLYLYTEALKRSAIEGDTLEARRLLREAVGSDSMFAPASYELGAQLLHTDPAEAALLARRAHLADTANPWYHRLLGQALVVGGAYGEALGVYRDLTASDSHNPDNYRMLAALYDEMGQPFSAIATLDSAERRFGRLGPLAAMKRQLLLKTHQTDRAIEEARAEVEEAPYEAGRHVTLAQLYGAAGRDSLALDAFAEALRIDSTSLPALMALADYHNERHRFEELLGIYRQLFAFDALPLEAKIRRFGQMTADHRFYRRYYPQINELAALLAIRYPGDERVTELYARHLMASGELEQALAQYKLLTVGPRPSEEAFREVIGIESYLRRPDSVDRYIDRALERFPDKAEFRIAKANSLALAGAYGPAVEAYRASLRYADSDSLRGAIWGLTGDAWQMRAKALDASTRRGRRDAARAMEACYRAYERSLAYNPENASVLNNYAYFLSLEGRDLEKALEMSSHAVALTDNDPTVLDTHAWVLFRLGRTAEARKVMQQAVALDGSNSPELLVHYGDILQASGERFMAESYWRKALDKGYDPAQIERRLQPEPAKE